MALTISSFSQAKNWTFFGCLQPTHWLRDTANSDNGSA